MTEREAYIAFSHCAGIGPMTFKELTAHFGSALQAYRAPSSQLQSIVRANVLESFLRFREEFSLTKIVRYCQEKEIMIITLLDTIYPSPLKNISDPPICLYARGTLGSINFEQDFLFAVVGTRRPSEYGRTITKKITEELSSAGIVIVSGMALGIDSVAHGAAIASGSRTVAVLGCGVDICYPPGNKVLYEKIIESGLVISEFPPGHTVLPGLFVARNRLISGLSQGVLLIEGTSHSGGLITCRYAAEQGKEVFAPPVPLTSDLSQAPMILLKEGATLVGSASDIAEAFNIRISRKKQQVQKLLPAAQRIYEALIHESLAADELPFICKVDIKNILPLLSQLEIAGVIEKNKEGKYQIA